MTLLSSPSAILPTPDQLGVAGYDHWYPTQDEAVGWLLNTLANQRTAAVCRPTGGGKSLMAWAAALLRGDRAVFLAPTKALQDQYASTLAANTEGVVTADVRGQNAYRCLEVRDKYVSVEDGPCHSGYDCPLKDSGCLYFDAVRKAQYADLITTNPFFYLTQQKFFSDGQPFQHRGSNGKPDGPPVSLLVCDEADALLDQLSDFLTITIQREQVERLLATTIPEQGASLQAVQQWAQAMSPRVSELKQRIEREIEGRQGRGDPELSKLKREVDRLAEAVSGVATQQGEWVVSWTPRNASMKLQPIWPSDYVEKSLLKGIDQLIIMSGTLTARDAALFLESCSGEYAYKEFEGFIRPEDRLIKHVKTSQMSFGRANYSLWINRIDQFVTRRQDRKGLLHTTSYDRRDRFVLGSRFRGQKLFLSHGSDDLASTLAEYKQSPPPKLLVSPSLVRGYDFPGDECRYIIIGKVPWPDTRDPVVSARKERDPLWPHYQAMKTVQQEVGRGARFPGDWCEIVVFDDDWRWFWGKYSQLATKDFQRAVVGGSLTTLPEPRGLGD